MRLDAPHVHYVFSVTGENTFFVEDVQTYFNPLRGLSVLLSACCYAPPPLPPIALTVCFRIYLLVLTVCFVSGVFTKKKLLEGVCTHSTLRCV